MSLSSGTSAPTPVSSSQLRFPWLQPPSLFPAPSRRGPDSHRPSAHHTRTCGPVLPLSAQSPHLPIGPSLTGSTLSSLWPSHPSPGDISIVPPLNCSPVWLEVSTGEPHFSVPAMSLQGPSAPASRLQTPDPPPQSGFPQSILLRVPRELHLACCPLSAPHQPHSAPGALPSGSPRTSLAVACQALGVHPHD